MSTKKTKTVGRSFRINEQWLNTLDLEAERAGISPNALLNRILQEYTESQRFVRRFGGMIVSRKSLSRLLDACPIEAVEEVAIKAGGIIGKDLFRTMGLKYNYENFTYAVLRIFGGYANWFTCERHVIKDTEYFHLRHDMGEKWSLYVSKMLETLLYSCCNRKMKIELMEGAVTLEIPIIAN